MSYEIVYNSQFIKTKEGKIIPLALYGSNNCYEMDNKRRSRGWSTLYFGNTNMMINKTELEIMETIKSFTGRKYQEHFKKNSKWIDDKGLINFFKNGIKKAMTIEELQEKYYNCSSLHGYFSIWQGFNNNIENNIYIKNSEELENFLNTAKTRIKNRQEEESIYICLEFMTEKLKSWVKPVKKPKEILDKYYVITINESGYLVKLTARNIKYTYNLSNEVKQFKTEKVAQNYLNKLLERKFNCNLSIKYISA